MFLRINKKPTKKKFDIRTIPSLCFSTLNIDLGIQFPSILQKAGYFGYFKK